MALAFFPLTFVGVVELYHSVGHSLLAVVVLAVLAARNTQLFAVWIGWVSHLALDVLQMVINGRPQDSQFLLWPFLRHRPAVELPPIEFTLHYITTPAFGVELLLWILFIGVVIRSRLDGSSSSG